MSEHQAGRELDTLVAEKVMGWRRKEEPSDIWCLSPPWVTRHGALVPFSQTPGYSTEIDAAWQVIEAMQAYCCDFTLEKAGSAWYAEFIVGSAGADTAPLAICLAALAAVEGAE
jgi:hypothetical protein